jgi:hypothetical protein
MLHDEFYTRRSGEDAFTCGRTVFYVSHGNFTTWNNSTFDFEQIVAARFAISGQTSKRQGIYFAKSTKRARDV